MAAPSNVLIRVEVNFAERHYYTPALGLSFLVAFLAWRLAGPAIVRRAAWVLLGAWLAMNAGLCVKRSLDWHDNETLFRTDVRSQPDSVSIRIYLSGMARHRYLETGDQKHMDEWRHHLEDALEIDDGSPGPLNSMAVWHTYNEEYDKAEEYLHRGMASRYYHPRTDGPLMYENLASIYRVRGQLRKCEEYLEESLKCDPLHHEALHQLLDLAAGRNDGPRLIELRERARESDSEPHPLYDMYDGLLAHRRGDHAAAVKLLEAALPRLERTRDEAGGRSVVGRGQVALGQSLLESGRTQDGLGVLERCVQDGMDSFGAGDHEAAIVLLEPALPILERANGGIAKVPGLIRGWVILAQSFGVQRQPQKGLQIVERYLLIRELPRGARQMRMRARNQLRQR